MAPGNTPGGSGVECQRMGYLGGSIIESKLSGQLNRGVHTTFTLLHHTCLLGSVPRILEPPAPPPGGQVFLRCLESDLEEDSPASQQMYLEDMGNSSYSLPYMSSKTYPKASAPTRIVSLYSQGTMVWG